MSTTPSYSKVITINSGGDFTPTESDVNLSREYIKARASSSTAQRATVGGTGVNERGLPAGDYYLVFTGTDASYRLVYEEMP
jgi:hypothetical protein